MSGPKFTPGARTTETKMVDDSRAYDEVYHRHWIKITDEEYDIIDKWEPRIEIRLLARDALLFIPFKRAE